MERGTGPAAPTTSSGGKWAYNDPSYSGCHEITASYTRYTILGMFDWRYERHINWCWYYGRTITSGPTGYDNFYGDSTANYKGLISHSWNWYTYFSGWSRSGFRSMHEIQVDYCILKGCYDTRYAT